MKLSKLALLACPMLMVLILVAPDSAQAQEIVTQPNDTKSVARPVDIVFDRPTPKPSTNVTETPSNNEVPTLDFTDKEAQAAIQRYGCDCSSCISSIQQLQGKLPLLQ